MRARLRNATLSDARLGKADLGEANLRSAECTDVYLGGANLRGADLRTAILDGANFEEADLSRADLRECDLSSAILHGATLEGAKVFGLSISRESIEAIRIKWWDVSRAGDGTAREEGSGVGAFIEADSGANGGGQHPQPSTPAARFFGEDDVLRNAELEFGAASSVDVQGLFENCSITLGEGAELKIGPAGVIRDCRISGEGNVLIQGQMLNRNGNTPTTSKTFFVGSTGTAVGTIQQPRDLTRFGFEPGCTLRLKIRT
jgi:hypothetical protein